MNAAQQPMPAALNALFSRWTPAHSGGAHPLLEAVFSAGHTNRNFLVRIGPERLVVRIPDVKPGRFGIDRVLEARVLTAVSDLGIAPDILLCEPDTGILVSRYVSSRPLRVDGIRADQRIDRVAEAMSALHRLTIDAPIVSLLDRVRYYADQIPRSDKATRKRARGWLDACRHALEAYHFSRGTACLCHHDLVAANVLDTDRGPIFIDWEYAALGDPFFDLATLAEEHNFGRLDRERLLLSYGEPWPEAHERLRLARIMHRLLSVLWYLVRIRSARTVDAMQAALVRHEQALTKLLDRQDDL